MADAVAPGAPSISGRGRKICGPSRRRGPLGRTLFGVFVVFLMFASPAAGQAEMEILDEYLEQYDEHPLSVNSYCHRQGGYQGPRNFPTTPQIGQTNDILNKHAAWHWQYAALGEPNWSVNDVDSYGHLFLEFHHDLVHDYEDWRERNGHAPLLSWDPALPIPPEFAYEVDLPCLARASDDPGIGRPSWLTLAGGEVPAPFWNYTALCEFPTWNRLGKALDEGFHGDVHEAVGGDMEDFVNSPRDPVFWAWHKTVDDIAHEWEACGEAPEVEPAAAKSSPHPGLWIAIAFAALIRRRW